jgi:hypothetical protein
VTEAKELGMTAATAAAAEKTSAAATTTKPLPLSGFRNEPLEDEPTVPTQVWRLRVSTMLELKRAAMESHRTIAFIVRELLDTWAEARRKQARRKQAAGQAGNGKK